MNSYIRVEARGRENIPAAGPFILAPNHTSHLDAPSILTAVGGRRRVWIAGAEDYFFNTALKRFVFGTLFDTIAFDRQADGMVGLAPLWRGSCQGRRAALFPRGHPLARRHKATVQDRRRRPGRGAGGSHHPRPHRPRLRVAAERDDVLFAPGSSRHVRNADPARRRREATADHYAAFQALTQRGSARGRFSRQRGSRVTREAAFFDVDGTLCDTTIAHYYRYFMLRRLLAARGQVVVFDVPYEMRLLPVARQVRSVTAQRRFLSQLRRPSHGGDQGPGRRLPSAGGRASSLWPSPGCIEEHRRAAAPSSWSPARSTLSSSLWPRRFAPMTVIAARLIESNGCFTGELDGPPIGGEEKARRMRDFAAEPGYRPVALPRLR